MTRRSRWSRQLNVVKVKTVENGLIDRKRRSFVEGRSQQSEGAEPVQGRFTGHKIANGQQRGATTRVAGIDDDDPKRAEDTALLQLDFEADGLHLHGLILGVAAEKGGGIGLHTGIEPSGRAGGGVGGGQRLDGELQGGVGSVGQVDGVAVANQPAAGRVKSAVERRQLLQVVAGRHQIGGPQLAEAVHVHLGLFFVLGHRGQEAKDVFERQGLRVFQLLEDAADKVALGAVLLAAFLVLVLFLVAERTCCGDQQRIGRKGRGRHQQRVECCFWNRKASLRYRHCHCF